MDERRKNPRFPVAAPVRLTAGATSAAGRLRDICRDAALVEVEVPLALGAFVTLSLELPGTGDGFMVSGKVIRMAPGEAGGHATAVLFTEVPPAAAARIDFFLALQTGAVG